MNSIESDLSRAVNQSKRERKRREYENKIVEICIGIIVVGGGIGIFCIYRAVDLFYQNLTF